MTETHVDFAYIDLQETNYKVRLEYDILPLDTDPAPLLEIYRKYCIHTEIMEKLLLGL
mgnify:CR=1 FL=1